MAEGSRSLITLIGSLLPSGSDQPNSVGLEATIVNLAQRQERVEAAMADLLAGHGAKDYAAKREWTLQVYERQYKLAENYTKAIIAVGYIVAFGLWSFMKPSVPDLLNYCVAFLLGISAMSFVLWEVWRALGELAIGRELGLLATTRSLTFEEWEASVRSFEMKTTALSRQTLRWNALSFWISVSTGFTAGVILAEWFFLGALGEFLKLVF